MPVVKLIHPTQSQDLDYYNWVHAAVDCAMTTWDEFDEQGKVALAHSSIFLTDEQMLLNLLKDRYISIVYEMIHFTFRIDGLSRTMTHQLVRHRKMAFGQQSMRVADLSNSPFAHMGDIEHDPEAKGLIQQHWRNSQQLYNWLIKNNRCVREQARNVMPMGTVTSITMTADLGALISYIKARSGELTQDEHKIIVGAIKKELEIKQPKFWKFIEEKIS